MRWILTIILLLSCAKAKDEPDPLDPVEPIPSIFYEATTRLMTQHLEAGWVVSRDGDDPAHVGEGLLWTGMWLTVASCVNGAHSEAMLQKMIESHDGALVRYEPLGEYEGGREVTLDGALGLYRGVAYRIKHCPTSREAWLKALTLHKEFLDAHGGRLHPGVDEQLTPEFDLLLDLLLADLSDGGFDLLRSGRIGALVDEVSAWTLGVMVTHAPAYRANLSLITLQTLEELGVEIPQSGRDKFCAVSNGIDIPTVDHWCGRGDLPGWIMQFHYDEWEYRHQRSGAWESPDGDGLKTPALDLLVGIKQAYAL